MQALLDNLAPRPRRVELGEGTFSLGETGAFSLAGAPGDTQPALCLLQKSLGAGWRLAQEMGQALIRFALVPQVAGAQSYRLRIAPDGVYAEAQDRAGLFYAAVTLAQLTHLSGRVLSVCEIEDAPDFPARGVMLDISRDKVPTMETLFRLADLLAGLKINQFQLYTEHTFAYRGHEAVWRDASPMTPEQVRALDAYCAARCIELVPNQNSFGHLERWLTLPQYNGLAELPQGGAPLPWGGVHEKPTSLCPTDPRSLAFLEDLYDQLLPNFSSTLFNAGCDETFDLLGGGRSAESVQREGEGRVYLAFIRKIQRLVSTHGKTMAFWGDIIVRHPELVPELPPGLLALEWGYEADHPFDAHGALFAKSGVPFYVCPGTSSWNSLAGRTSNMLANMRSAAGNGLRHGACGYLITDWGDGGHWQPLCVSFPGYLYGAALAWGAARNGDIDVAAGVDTWLAAGCGQALLGLGDVYLRCGALRGNGTELFQILAKPAARPLLPGVTEATLHAVLAEVDRLADALPKADSTDVREAGHIVRLLRAACHRGAALLSGGLRNADTRRALARETDALTASHAEVWRLRNREGGLKDSLARFAAIRAEYADGEPVI